MTHITDDSQPQTRSSSDALNTSTRSYARIWRWHFYSGLFITPFLAMLSITGLLMMLFAYTDGRDGEQIWVTPQGQPQPIAVQAQHALDAFEKGTLKQYIAPRTNDMVAVFRVDTADKRMMVAINPYTAQVVKVYPRRSDFYHLLDDIHGTFLLGKTGDFFIEAAASFSVLMIITGWYLWWMRQRSVRGVMAPKLGKGKAFWRNSHGATGAWMSVVLLFFLVSGLAWAGIWGAKMVQAWSQFPAEKWGKPTSTLTHGDLINEGSHEVPWVLELTPMPISDTRHNGEVAAFLTNLDTLEQHARALGFEGRYQLHFPSGETGVWTISQDSMSYDSNSPTADRTVHLDQYSGETLADVRYEDYNWMGKFMAVGIALHMGNLGWWSILANTIFCLAILFMCVGGVVMWWKRRPSQAKGIVPPAANRSKVGVGLGVLLLVLSAAFPTALAVVAVVFLVDFILVSRVPVLCAYVK